MNCLEKCCFLKALEGAGPPVSGGSYLNYRFVVLVSGTLSIFCCTALQRFVVRYEVPSYFHSQPTKCLRFNTRLAAAY